MPSPPDSHLSQVTRLAARRWKLERGKAALFKTLIWCSILEGIWALVLIFNPSWVSPFPFLAATAVLTVIGILIYSMFRQPNVKTLHRCIDRRLGLPDMTLTTGELSGESPWELRLEERTEALIINVNWKKVWPIPWPKWTGISVFSGAVLFWLLSYYYQIELNSLTTIHSNPKPHNLRASALEAVFKDWDLEKNKDEELKKMLEKVAPLRAKLTDPATNERQCFENLNQLEEMVAAKKAAIEAQSMEPQATNLADAFQPMEGMSALAAALRKKDFEKASEQALQTAKKLGAENAEVPKGSKEAAQAVQKIAEQLGNRSPAKQALSQFSEGAKEGDCKKMSDGMQSLKQCLSQQSARNAESKRLATQLAQLSFCKNPGTAASKNGGMNLMPTLSMGKSNQPGKGAGSETDLNRFGAETNLTAERHAETMNNISSEGESETRTIKSNSSPNEATRSTQNVNFQKYQQLSQQAITDEAIPAAHREAIKRYFQKIRPDAGN